ncbi:MAG: hypothetical protein WA584_03995 [Pyrinomonadaceae bacterium]
MDLLIFLMELSISEMDNLVSGMNIPASKRELSIVMKELSIIEIDKCIIFDNILLSRYSLLFG